MSDFKYYGISRRRISSDGEGITDLIALANCHMSCKYCINKELIESSAIKTISPEKLLEEVSQEACYFVATNGGVTFGGGEPLLQYKAIKDFCEIKPEWLNVNIETSLNVPEKNYKSLIPYIKEWVIDIKTLNHKMYKQYTGLSFSDMYRNLAEIANIAPEKCHIRVPYINGFKSKKFQTKEEEILRDMGFLKLELFDYVIPKEPNNSTA